MFIKKNIGLICSLLAVLIVSVVPMFTLRKENYIYKRNGSYNFAFNLDVISPNSKDKIEFLGANGKNTKDLLIRLIDNGDTILRKNKNNIKTILCECETDNRYTRIDSLRLRINGKEKKINLKFPIENKTMNNIININ